MLYPRTNTRMRHRRLSGTFFLVPLAVACSLTACSGAVETALAQERKCSVQVIVRHAAEPDSALLADLGRTNALELEPVGVITRDVRVYTLRAPGTNDDCIAAMDRLRRDERVRSVDLDARRGVHDQS
ncbi:MAG TPA: hypothetical protein VGL98_02990 [Gammaproteobacteria bacterium]